MIERIGFIGTGAIPEAIVTGLAAAPRELRDIWVSCRNQEAAARLDARPKLGLDTSGDTIATSVAVALEQESLSIQAAYIRDAQPRIRGTATFRDKEEHARLADENATLLCENARLRHLLAESETLSTCTSLPKTTESSSRLLKKTVREPKDSK